MKIFTFNKQVRNKDPESRSKRAKSREMKRATVVGNPMFSSSSSSNSSGSPTHATENSNLQREHDNETHQQQASTTATAASSSSTGLDDLNLGMDYNQIMQYFENLKESNA